MKVSQLRKLIREEAKRALNEGPLTNAIRPVYTGDIGKAVKELEQYLINAGDKYQWGKLADLIVDIVDYAQQEATRECYKKLYKKAS